MTKTFPLNRATFKEIHDYLANLIDHVIDTNDIPHKNLYIDTSVSEAAFRQFRSRKTSARYPAITDPCRNRSIITVLKLAGYLNIKIDIQRGDTQHTFSDPLHSERYMRDQIFLYARDRNKKLKPIIDKYGFKRGVFQKICSGLPSDRVALSALLLIFGELFDCTISITE